MFKKCFCIFICMQLTKKLASNGLNKRLLQCFYFFLNKPLCWFKINILVNQYKFVAFCDRTHRLKSVLFFSAENIILQNLRRREGKWTKAEQQVGKLFSIIYYLYERQSVRTINLDLLYTGTLITRDTLPTK